MVVGIIRSDMGASDVQSIQRIPLTIILMEGVAERNIMIGQYIDEVSDEVKRQFSLNGWVCLSQWQKF